MSSALLMLHAFTGSDNESSFAGHRQKTAWSNWNHWNSQMHFETVAHGPKQMMQWTSLRGLSYFPLKEPSPRWTKQEGNSFHRQICHKESPLHKILPWPPLGEEIVLPSPTNGRLVKNKEIDHVVIFDIKLCMNNMYVAYGDRSWGVFYAHNQGHQNDNVLFVNRLGPLTTKWTIC